MEGMLHVLLCPGKQRPCLQTDSTTPAATQQQSPDSTGKKIAAQPKSALLKKRGRDKKVHWDISVVDNEKEPKSSSSQTSSPRISWSVLPRINSAPSHLTSIAVPAIANTSTRLDSPSPHPAQSAFPSSLRESPRAAPQHQSQSLHHIEDAVASAMPSEQTTMGHRQHQAPVANSRSKMRPSTADHGTTRIEVEMGATKTSPQRHRHHSRTHHSKLTGPPIPPKVPDAPQPKFEGPPPTPRITRLPTPDLPEVGGDRFCSCDDTRITRERGHAMRCESYDREVEKCKKPVHVKMDEQLEAAMAYMKQVRKQGTDYRGFE